MIVLLLVPTVFGFCTFLAYRTIRHAETQVASITRVPPVAEQISALPAKAILVRASDEPATQPGEMLRAAHSHALIDGEDLLRAENRVAE